MTVVADGAGARAAHTAKLLAALANPQRLLILCHLHTHGETGAGALAEHFGFGQSALSQHLARMRAESLVVQRREGRALFYRINDGLTPYLPRLLDGICDPVADAPSGVSTRARTAVALSLAMTSTLADIGFWQTPAIDGAGQVHALPHALYQPDPDAIYKLVFVLAHGSMEPDQPNPGLDRVALAVNLYASAGVPVDHLKFVVIATGEATATALDDAHYAKTYHMANPNLPLIRRLGTVGVQVVVCGQALAHHRCAHDWISPDVPVALGMLPTLTELTGKGYTPVQL